MMRHWRLALLILLLLASGASLPPGSDAATGRAADDPGSWSPAAGADAPATGSVTTLAGGQVLVLTRSDSLDDGTARLRAARYDPATDRWTPGAQSGRHPWDGTAVPLGDGRALALFGSAIGPDRQTAGPVAVEIYDPRADRWSAVAAPGAARSGAFAATPLRDGRILVTGGQLDQPGGARQIADAELYDPAADRWTVAAPLAAPRAGHAAMTLPDGSVLVFGGRRDCCENAATVERYDPATGQWRAVASPPRALAGGAVQLADGQPFVVGGDEGGARYDPAADRWLDTAPAPFPERSPTPRVAFTVTALADGRVLAAGGQRYPCYAKCVSTPRLDTTFLYDPAADRWADGPAMLYPRSGHSATRLADGRVLVIGGTDAPRATPELYSPVAAPPRCFAETGKCLSGRFLSYWLAHGGLAINGLPLSDERAETLEDGRRYTVQYFERARFELHPENPPPYAVLLGQFGRRIHPADPPVSAGSRPGSTYFPPTGHTLGGRFARFWGDNGGVPQFGYPLTEEFVETLEDGRAYTVQYFERARFELHPENAAPNDIQLGQFGRRILAEVDLLSGGFAFLYTTDPVVLQGLGPPVAAAASVAGIAQPFERGLLLGRDDPALDAALCAGGSSGRWLRRPAAGGGEGALGAPVPPEPVSSGRYAPTGRFGALWRADPALRACLGYATTPAAVAAPLLAQRFAHGEMVRLQRPESAVIYVLYDTGTFERYAERLP
jgi:hypothetical protein